MSSETEASTRTWGVLGVPSSVAAHWRSPLVDVRWRLWRIDIS
jgi:hypothetical protein